MSTYCVTVAAPAAITAQDAPSVAIPFVPTRVRVIVESVDPTEIVSVYTAGDVERDETRILRLMPTVSPNLRTRSRGLALWLVAEAGTPNVTIIAEAL